MNIDVKADVGYWWLERLDTGGWRGWILVAGRSNSRWLERFDTVLVAGDVKLLVALKIKLL